MTGPDRGAVAAARAALNLYDDAVNGEGDPAALSWPRLAGQLAGSVRQLLRALDGVTVLGGAQLEVVRHALDDAIDYQDESLRGWCTDCEGCREIGLGACDDHLGALDRRRRYKTLLGELES